MSEADDHVRVFRGDLREMLNDLADGREGDVRWKLERLLEVDR